MEECLSQAVALCNLAQFTRTRVTSCVVNYIFFSAIKVVKALVSYVIQ